MSISCIDFIDSCLQKESSQRLSCDELERLPFLRLNDQDFQYEMKENLDQTVFMNAKVKQTFTQNNHNPFILKEEQKSSE